MINPAEISVVVQGPIYGAGEKNPRLRYTQRCCANIRKKLPGAEIILSTWEGSDVSGIDYDTLVLSKDPGGIKALIYEKTEKMDNTNRMIMSTREGINKVSRKYCIKLRSDMYIEAPKFLKYFGEYPIMQEDRSILKERVISLPCNSPHRSTPLVFTIQDWFLFGLTVDVKKIWCLPQRDDKNLVKRNGVIYYEDNLIGEAYVWTKFVESDPYYAEKLSSYPWVIPYSKKNLDLYEKSLAQYTVIYNGEQLGLNSYKLKDKNYVTRNFGKASCYTHTEWQKLYKKYFQKGYKVNTSLEDMLDPLMYDFTFHILERHFHPVYTFVRDNIWYKIGRGGKTNEV